MIFKTTPEVVHGACGDHGFLWIVEHVGQRVHPHVEVGDVHAHGLLTHSGLNTEKCLIMGSVTRITMWIVEPGGQRVHPHVEVGDVWYTPMACLPIAD